MKLLVSLLLFFLTVDSCWSHYDCEHANWWDSFQRQGWSACPSNKYIVGFYRSANSGGKDYISRLEEAKCCKAPRPNYYSQSTCQKIYFWSKFDRNWSQVKCPEGYFLHSLYRSNGNKWGYLSNIEEAQCCKPRDLPSEASCEWTSIWTSFDSAGLSECDYGYYMAGLYRGRCNELYCLEKLWCCKMNKIDGGWSSWSYWSCCSESCGWGSKARSRSCTSPAPRYGGEDCQARAARETRSCFTRSCTVFDCNFDTSMCGFVQDKNDKFDWTRSMGGTSSSQTGPSADHTTGNGYYMYIDTSSPRQSGDNAKLKTPNLQFSGKMCLTFYYYGANMGKLKVTINEKTEFSRSGDKGDSWLKATVNINLSGMYSVTFEGIRGSSDLGDIAIDDLLLVTEYCPSIITLDNEFW